MLPTVENNTFIRMKQVTEMTSLSKSYLYNLSAQGLFPKSVPLVPGGSSKAWIKSEVQNWIDQRIAERDQEGVSNDS